MKPGFYLSPDGLHVAEISDSDRLGLPLYRHHGLGSLFLVNVGAWDLKLWDWEVAIIFSAWEVLE